MQGFAIPVIGTIQIRGHRALQAAAHQHQSRDSKARRPRVSQGFRLRTGPRAAIFYLNVPEGCKKVQSAFEAQYEVFSCIVMQFVLCGQCVRPCKS